MIIVWEDNFLSYDNMMEETLYQIDFYIRFPHLRKVTIEEF